MASGRLGDSGLSVPDPLNEAAGKGGGPRGAPETDSSLPARSLSDTDLALPVPLAVSTDPRPDAGLSGGRLDHPTILRLYEAHRDELRRLVVGIVRDVHQAEDVLQAVLTRLIEQGHAARPETRRGWMFRVAANEALLVKRKQTGERRALEQWLAAARAESIGPDRQAIHREVANRVKQGLTRLPPEQREVVRRRIDARQTFAEIAAELQVPLGTVLGRMQAALKRLAVWLKDDAG